MARVRGGWAFGDRWLLHNTSCKKNQKDQVVVHVDALERQRDGLEDVALEEQSALQMLPLALLQHPEAEGYKLHVLSLCCTFPS